MRFNLTERLGVHEAAIVCTKELKWIFREQPLVDVGIDALIEESIQGQPTGKFLAAQIKSGAGNFHENDTSFTLYVSNIHYQYWLNLDLPIIVIAYLPDIDLLCWEFLDQVTLVPTKKRWKVQIPKSKIFNTSSLKELQTIINSVQSDFLTQFLNGKIEESELQKILESLEKIQPLTDTLLGLTDIMNEMTSGLHKNTIKLTLYNKKNLGTSSREIKSVISETSSLIKNKALKLDELILNFSLEFTEAFDAFEKIALLNFHINKNYKELQSVYDTMDILLKNIKYCIDSLISLRNEVSTFPSDYPNLNKSRIKMLDTCNHIISEFKVSKSMTNKFCQWMYEKLF